MTVRAAALRWLAATHRVRDGDIFTSRYYPAAESWTGHAAWWFTVPVRRVESLGAGAVHLVAEAGPPDAIGFHYLCVPAAFFREHLAALDRPGDGSAVSLFLSAEPGDVFRDARGPGRVDFAPFAVPPARGVRRPPAGA